MTKRKSTVIPTERTNFNRPLTAGDGHKRRKSWEIQMALDTLEHFGAVIPVAEILGVGAGREDTIFHLSNKVRRVFATDLYLDPGAWTLHHKPDLLMGKYPDIPHNPQRIIFQHMDGRCIQHPSESFEGVFSSGSIEHFGAWDDIAQAAREIGRVLKPGGIASISTEFKISGDGDGWPGVKLFTPETLQRYIIEPSGLSLVDEPTWDQPLGDETLATAWSLEAIVARNEIPPQEVVLSHDGYLFTSVHLALVKGY